MEDGTIVELYWQRCERAIAESEAKYGGYCLCIAGNILPLREDARECVNDTWLGAWRSIPPARPAVLRTYLGKITRRLALKRWRDDTRQKRGGGEVRLSLDELTECLPAAESTEERAQVEELAEVLGQFVAELPDAERRVFLRRYWYLLPVEEIAREYGFGVSKVKSMLHRTRQKLRTRLGEKGFL